MTGKWLDGELVPMTAEEKAEFDAFQQEFAQEEAQRATRQQNEDTIRDELVAQMQQALQLADALDAGNATAAQQRAGLAMCLRGVVRLAKVVYRSYDTAV